MAEARPDWVGQRAIAWVIDDAPVPKELAFTLTVIARRCDDNGKGSYQSAKTIAEKTGKSKQQAERDIARLKELGLILPGDQSLLAHLPPGQRPAVYDVPLNLKGPKPSGKSKNPTGGKKDGETATMEGGTTMHAGTPMEGGPTTSMDAGGTTTMHAGQIKPLKNPKRNPSLSAARSDVIDVEATDERDDSDSSQNQKIEKPDPLAVQRSLLAKHGITDEEQQDYVAGALESEHQVRSIAWWRAVDKNGDLPGLIAAINLPTDLCGKCRGTGKYLGRSIYGDIEVEFTCTECDNAPCLQHPGVKAKHCSPCRADRLAEGYRAPPVNLPPGQHKKSWEQARERSRHGYHQVHGTHDADHTQPF